MSRRRALMLAAAATTVTTGCPKTAPPEPCLSVEIERHCHDEHVVFGASLTTLDAKATERIDELAARINEQGLNASLSVFAFDDGHAEAASALNAPRLEAVRAALVERGVESSLVAVTPLDPQSVRMPPETWRALTGDGTPLPLSGLVTIDC